MPASLADQLQRMCAHDIAANVRMLGALHGLGDTAPQKAIDRMAHVALTIELWLHRMGAFPEKPGNIFPEGAGLHAVAQHAELAGRAWSAFVETLTDEQCDREFDFVSTEGSEGRMRIADALAHMSLHGQYHRGQVSILCSDLLPEPLVTDYAYFARGDW
jgi:uncharacterized damage-inducible protein DinB